MVFKVSLLSLRVCMLWHVSVQWIYFHWCYFGTLFSVLKEIDGCSQGNNVSNRFQTEIVWNCHHSFCDNHKLMLWNLHSCPDRTGPWASRSNWNCNWGAGLRESPLQPTRFYHSCMLKRSVQFTLHRLKHKACSRKKVSSRLFHLQEVYFYTKFIFIIKSWVLKLR